MSVATYRPFAGLGLAVDLPIGDDFFVEWGHFKGKEGVHLNGRLEKRRALDDPRLRSWVVAPMRKLVEQHNPDCLLGHGSGATVARELGRIMGVQAYELTDDRPDGSLAATRNVLVDDNYITGRQLTRNYDQLAAIGAEPVAAVMMFNSSGEDITATNSFPLEAAHDLSIDAQAEADCGVCQALGSYTLGLTALEFERIEGGGIGFDACEELGWH